MAFCARSRADREYGRAMGAIISNEVDSQCVWSNAGEMSCEEFTHEYSEACRLAWLLGRKHFANFRVYMSLDQFFSGVRFRPLEPRCSGTKRPSGHSART